MYPTVVLRQGPAVEAKFYKCGSQRTFPNWEFEPQNYRLLALQVFQKKEPEYRPQMGGVLAQQRNHPQ